jgi:hypothetical protein
MMTDLKVGHYMGWPEEHRDEGGIKPPLQDSESEREERLWLQRLL